MTTTTHISTSGGLISTTFSENIRQAWTNQRGTQPDTFGLPREEAPEDPDFDLEAGPSSGRR